ncbi:MAG: spore germination protein [Vallitalea sp.]|nr:spore germination protein [Vallitalea sp.]
MNSSLTGKQISYLLFGITMGYAVLSIPKNVAEKGGTGGWMVVIVGVIITIVLSQMFIYVGTYFTNETMDEYLPKLTGNFISYCIIIIFAIYTFLVGTLIARLTCETIRLTMLIHTPVWALCVLLLFVSFYSMTKSFQSLGRIAEIFGMIIIIFGIMIFTIIFTQGKITNIKPIFAFSEIDFFGTLSVIGFSLTGLEIFPIIPMHNNKKEISKNIIIIQLIIGFMYILIIECCISVMGVESIIKYEETLFATMRRIELPQLQFLKRIDGIFLIVWLLALYFTVLYECYITVYFTEKLIKVNKASDKNKNIIILIIFIISIIVCLAPSSLLETKSILNIIGYVGIGINIGLPLILFILTKLKKNKKTRFSIDKKHN